MAGRDSYTQQDFSDQANFNIYESSIPALEPLFSDLTPDLVVELIEETKNLVRARGRKRPPTDH